MRAWVVAAAVVASGCSSETSMLLIVGGDLFPPTDYDGVDVELSAQGAQLSAVTWPVGSGTAVPFSMALSAPRGGSLDVDLTVTASLEGDSVLDVVRPVSFVHGREVEVRVCFWRACIGSELERCRFGRCEDVTAGGDGDADADAADGGGEADADMTGDSGGEDDADGVVDVGAAGDADARADAEAGGDADEGDAGADTGAPGCAEEMVQIPSLAACIDRWEASQESPGGPARSVPGVTPTTNISRIEASAACEASGKRLCTDLEWVTACQGVPAHTYPYGDAFDTTACFGAENGGPHEAPATTGSHPGCEGAPAGLFDMTGNVSEWLSTCVDSACTVRGGSFLDSGELAMSCSGFTYSVSEASYGATGFRCCRSFSE